MRIAGRTATKGTLATMTPSELPLSALLSKVLIAFTLDVDREFEQQLGGEDTVTPSLFMYAAVMRFIDAGGVDERALPELAGISKQAIHASVAGLQRWGYIRVESDLADTKARILHATRRGQHAQTVWRASLRDTEQRWESRFGDARMHALREALELLAGQLDDDLPHYPVTMPNRGAHPRGK